uniref:Uncharacterized protein n=1 Tax=Solanum tuberosum TaxID=4113 RepID=M1DAR3_SOLTU
MSEKTEKVERYKNCYLPKPLGDSLSGPAPKVPACQHMNKLNLVSKQVIPRHAEEVGDDDLARQILQNRFDQKGHAKKVRRGVLNALPTSSANPTYFVELITC